MFERKITLELTEREAESLESFIENNNAPCKDCSPDKNCGLHEKGVCIAQNMESILQKVRSNWVRL